MDLCTGGRGSKSHTEIVHDESSCPLCEAKEEIEALENKVETLEEKIVELEEE